MPLTEAELAQRLREVEHHLREVPPHHGGGLHDQLQRQRDDLRKQLAAMRRPPVVSGPARPSGHPVGGDAAATPPDPRANAVRTPAPATPAAPPGAFRRTTHVAAGPAAGHDWSDGDHVPRSLHGACRDLRTADGSEELVTVRAEIDADHRLDTLVLDPGPAPRELLGELALPGMRRLVRGAVTGDLAAPRAAVLLDLGVGGTLSDYARLQERRRSGLASHEAMRPDALERLGDSCRGWARDGDMVTLLRAGVNRPPKPPPAVPDPDLDGWHDLGDLPPGWMRRRRRIDVVADGPSGLRVEAAFRDSWRDPDGPERSLHEWELELALDADGRITAVDATARSLPFDVCPSVAANLDGLVGTDMDGLRHRMRDVLGGVAGCTHLNDLLSTIPAAVARATQPAR